MIFTLTPGKLSLADIRLLLDEKTELVLDPSCFAAIDASENVIRNVLAANKTVYGINTGFGALAHKKIETHELELLQRSLVLSHAAGTGTLCNDKVVRLMLALKINSLARGYSGVRRVVIDYLIRLFNARIYPCIPCQGSVGASGDLAPLAHMSAVLLATGEARCQNHIISAEEALARLQLPPLELAPKEGLALLNGTQASTAFALTALLAAEDIFAAGIATGAMSVDAALGSDTPFDERIQLVRGHAGQIQVAAWLRELLAHSEIRSSHHLCHKVQDPYSLRCQPQVMGACLSQMQFVRHTLMVEANAVSDNPLIFSEDNDVLSGGNFHAEPVAISADALAVCIAEIASISERRIALLVDPSFSGLPAFLVPEPGTNSGFMIAQVTAAALASENKSLAHPASVDSLPTSANQEDHVSMATFAARRLHDMINNAAGIIGIELLAACQAIDMRRPLKTSPILEKIHAIVRKDIAFYAKDRYFAPDIAKIKHIIQSGHIRQQLNLALLET